MLKISNLFAGYVNNDFILKDIKLEISKGETLLIIGNNGTGKSTLAKAIINNLPEQYGEIIFNKNILFNSKKNIKLKTEIIINSGIGYFLQGGRVFPQLTVEENLFIANNRNPGLNNSKYFNTLKNKFDIILKSGKEKATYLSLGQKHLLALAMVLLKDPSFLILDEPTAGLDDKNVEIVTEIITELKNKNDLSILLIEHRTEEIKSLADRRVEVVDGKIK